MPPDVVSLRVCWWIGLVAQLVEQRTENPRVGGSIPSQATEYGKRRADLGRRAVLRWELNGWMDGRHPGIAVFHSFTYYLSETMEHP